MSIKKSLIVEKLLKIIIRESRIKGFLVCGLKETAKFILKVMFLIYRKRVISVYLQEIIAIKALCRLKNVKLFIVSNIVSLIISGKLLNRSHKWKKSYKITPCSSCLVLKSKTFNYHNHNINNLLALLSKFSTKLLPRAKVGKY
uniref:Ribosomal protein S12 n=1 Tax=Amorphochlora amoebiformis TaxID=1561963 RepID=A0A0H5BKF3_9EUKA|nr:ribosomal protein S12 [Amorphochlora amoebiformis]